MALFKKLSDRVNTNQVKNSGNIDESFVNELLFGGILSECDNIIELKEASDLKTMFDIREDRLKEKHEREMENLNKKQKREEENLERSKETAKYLQMKNSLTSNLENK